VGGLAFCHGCWWGSSGEFLVKCKHTASLTRGRRQEERRLCFSTHVVYLGGIGVIISRTVVYRLAAGAYRLDVYE